MTQNLVRHLKLVLPSAVVLAVCSCAAGQRVVFATADAAPPNELWDVITLSETGVFTGVFAPYSTTERALHLATDETHLLVGVITVGQPNYRVDKYLLTGSLVQQFPIPNGLISAFEADRAGNLYTLSAPMVHRFGPSGTQDLTLNLPSSSYGGVDADADGNIFVSQYNVLHKFSPNGALIGSVPLSRSFVGNIAIDENADLLYLGYQPGGFEVYDISQTMPTLLSYVNAGEGIHLHHDSSANTLFLLGGNGVASEYSTGGMLMNLFIPPAPYQYFTDTLAATVPEPNSLFLLPLLLFLRMCPAVVKSHCQ